MYTETLPPEPREAQPPEVATSTDLRHFWKKAGEFFVGEKAPKRRTEFLTFHTVTGLPVCTDDDWAKTNYALTALTPPQLRLLTAQIPEWCTRRERLEKNYPHGFQLDFAPRHPEPVISEKYKRARAAEAEHSRQILDSPEHQSEAERRRQKHDVASFRATRPDPNHGFPLVFHNGAPDMEEMPLSITTIVPNIHQRIVKVYSAIGAIPATGRNSQYNYNYIPQGAIVARIRELLAENGILLETHFLGAGSESIPGGKSGGEKVSVKMRFALVNADNPDDRIVFDEWPGSDSDFSGKGLGKGIANARRTFLISQFLVSDEDTEHPPPSLPPSQPPSLPPSQPPRGAPPAEPPDDSKPSRDRLLSDLKILREAEKKIGIPSDPMTKREAGQMDLKQLDIAVCDSRQRLFAAINKMEKEREKLNGRPVSNRATLYEMDHAEVASHAEALFLELNEK